MSFAARAAKSITITLDPTVSDADSIIREVAQGISSGVYTGKSISEEKALGFVPVWAAVRLLSETIATLPLHVYQRQGRGKSIARDHRMYAMLHDAPNPEMTAFVWRETMQSHLLTWGNAFSEIEYDTDGIPLYLWPLRPDKMRVTRQDGVVTYLYRTANGIENRLSRRQILHIPGLSFNGLVGYSPVQVARQAIAVGLAAEEMAGRFYANDARPGVVIKHPLELSEKAASRLAESFDATHTGLTNKYRTAVLDEGMDITTLGFPADDAQLIEQQKWSVEQTARIFNVPPHMIHHLERATFNNIEEMGQNFAQYSVAPWTVRWQQQFNLQLFQGDLNHFPEFVLEGLVRGRLLDRMQAYFQMFQMGGISPSEIREKENLNALPGGIGDSWFYPVNLAPLGTTPEPPAIRSTKTADQRGEVSAEFRPLFEQVTRDILAFERGQVLAEAARRFGENTNGKGAYRLDIERAKDGTIAALIER